MISEKQMKITQKELVVACFEIFSPQLPGGSGKTMKNFGQDSVSSSWSFNVGPPECCVLILQMK
jgi:hypothetical protein